MAEGFIAKEYQTGDEEGIVELLEIVFDGWPHFDLPCSSVDHWKWKFLDNPVRSSFVTYVEYEERMVGTQATIYKRIKIGDRMFTVSNGVDVGTHPEFRRMGVKNINGDFRTQLLDERRRPNAFGISLTGNTILKQRNVRRGSMVLPYKLKLYLKITDISKFIDYSKPTNKLMKKYGYMAFMAFNRVKNLLYRKKYRNKIKIIKISDFDDDNDIFFDRVRNHYDFIYEKKKEYLNWRYCDPRGGEFIVFQAVEEDDEILGFVVLRINRYDPEHPVGYFADILTLPNREDVVWHLLERSLKYFEENNVIQINYWALEGHPVVDIISRLGFVDSRKGEEIFFGVKRMPEIWDVISKFSVENIHFQFGDTDWI